MLPYSAWLRVKICRQFELICLTSWRFRPHGQNGGFAEKVCSPPCSRISEATMLFMLTCYGTTPFGQPPVLHRARTYRSSLRRTVLSQISGVTVRYTSES